jgi:hypothetical protein
MRGFRKCAVKMDSDAKIHIPSFIMIGSGIAKLIRGIHSHTDSMVISIDYKESRLPNYFLNKPDVQGKSFRGFFDNFVP